MRHPADIVIFGGQAGGGKSFALLMEPLRHRDVPGFTCVIFRRTFANILKAGAIWDESMKMYPLVGGTSRLNPPTWTFPSGATVSFGHLERDVTVNDWHGSQIALLCFDEIQELTEYQFWYMLSRNRSACGVRPYVRATCNPDAESWLARLITWWIDQDTGYPIDERAGKIRWFIREGEELLWGATRDELIDRYGQDKKVVYPRSLAFIPSTLDDNPALMKADPNYRANIEALPTVERERLGRGNWKIRPSSGIMFPRDKWMKSVGLPSDARLIRYWDKAGTKDGQGARTSGVLVGEVVRGGIKRYYIADAVFGRWADAEREDKIKSTAELDRQRFGWRVRTVLEREPGSGGKFSTRYTIANLAGHDAGERQARTAKHIAWRPFASQVQNENVYLVTGRSDEPSPWDWTEFVTELDQLSGDPDKDKSLLRDMADAASGAFNELTEPSDVPSGNLFCSGTGEDDEDSRKPLDAEEVSELPDDIAELINTIRDADDGHRKRLNKEDEWWR